MRHVPMTGVLGFALLSGCVTTGTFDAKVKELEGVTAEHDRAAAEKQAALEAKVKALEARLADLSAERGELSGALGQTEQRLEELRKQKAAADAAAATFRTLVEKLKKMIDNGKLKVVIRDGRMLIALPNDILFDSGRVELKAEARAALTEVAKVLADIPDRHFLVAGHTDTKRIRTLRYPSNWHLSTARAVEVTTFLVAQGMEPRVLAAGGFGEFDPVASNDTDEGRALNRRIEIVLQPNLAELPSLEGLLAPAAPR